MIYFKASLKDSKVSSKLFFFLFVVVFCSIFTSPISFITASHPENIDLLKLVQLVTSLGIIILPSFIMAYFVSEKPLIFLGLSKKPDFILFLLVVILMMLAIPFINLLGDINQHMVLPKAFSGIETWMKNAEQQATQLTEKIVQVRTLSGLSINLFLIAVLPAFGEELFFRGVFQGIVKDWKGAVTAIWIGAIVFSAIHLQFYGFLPRMLMGALFGYLFFWSKSLWLPITAHFVNNALATIFYYLKFNGYNMPDVDSIGIGNTRWIGIASGLVTMSIIYYLFRFFQKRTSPNKQKKII
jgi:membrane protease YdiL (CAAX protease family)